MARMGFKSVDDVRAAQEDLGYAIGAFLRAAGWAHTSTTPGSYWMWVRELDGRKIMVDQATALALQHEIEHAARG